MYNHCSVLRGFVERDIRLHMAGRHTGSAIDALIGVNVEHLGRRKPGFVLARVDAIDRTDIDTSRILGPNARFTNDIGHETLKKHLMILGSGIFCTFCVPAPGDRRELARGATRLRPVLAGPFAPRRAERSRPGTSERGRCLYRHVSLSDDGTITQDQKLLDCGVLYRTRMPPPRLQTRTRKCGSGGAARPGPRSP